MKYDKGLREGVKMRGLEVFNLPSNVSGKRERVSLLVLNTLPLTLIITYSFEGCRCKVL